MSTFKENSYVYTNLVDLLLSNKNNIKDNKPIYIDADTEETINYGNFRTLVRQGSAGFLKKGVNKRDNVCLYSPNNVSCFICVAIYLFIHSI